MIVIKALLKAIDYLKNHKAYTGIGIFMFCFISIGILAFPMIMPPSTSASGSASAEAQPKPESTSLSFDSIIQTTDKITFKRNSIKSADFVLEGEGFLRPFQAALLSTPSTKADLTRAIDAQKDIVFHTQDGSNTTIRFHYDSYGYTYAYYNYIKTDKGHELFDKRYIDSSFFKMIDVCDSYTIYTGLVPYDVNRLFIKYNFTPAFRLDSESIVLPDDLTLGDNDDLEKLYWSQAMVMSKAIGFDFSKLLSKEITAEMYYLLEPVPSSYSHHSFSRGVVIRYDDRIVGAYIDSGCPGLYEDAYPKFTTLDSRSFKDVTRKEPDEYLAENNIDRYSPLYIKFLYLNAEQMIHSYYKALKEQDYNSLISMMSISSKLKLLYTGGNTLYRTGPYPVVTTSYIDEIDLISFSSYHKDSRTGELCYNMYTDVSKLNAKDKIILENRRNPWTLTLKSECGSFRIVEESYN